MAQLIRLFNIAALLRIVLYVTLALLPIVPYAQTMHEVGVGFTGKYWVDSVAQSKSMFEWKINADVVQYGKKASLVMQWNNAGQYLLSVQEISAEGCIGETRTCEVVVSESTQPLTIFGVNAFSPNNDNLNDVFKPLDAGDEIPLQYNLQIYNNWGQLLFETTNVHTGWNGTFKGQPCQPGVYIFTISFYRNGGFQKSTGSVTLIR